MPGTAAFTTGRAWVDRYLDPLGTYVCDNTDVTNNEFKIHALEV
jgi:hypothetical protein